MDGERLHGYIREGGLNMDISKSQLKDFETIVRLGLEKESPNHYFSITMLKIQEHLIKLYKESIE